MSSKFSNDVANNMESILNDNKFQRIFSKTASIKVTSEEEVDPNFEAFNAFSSDDDLTVIAAKKKKIEDEEDEPVSKKSDKKKDKKEDEEADKDIDKDEKKPKKSKKDEIDEDKKDDKKKEKKKSFPFFKKKSAGKCSCDENCACKKGEKCPCEGDCGECMSCGDKMYASALKHIVESFTVTSDVLDNMGLEKSAVATMAILNHIIEEAANIKFAKVTEEHAIKEKIKDLKEKFKKMHHNNEKYDADAAEELDKKITDLEDSLKKKHLNTDKNDVRGADLLLGLQDTDAREGFMDPEMDDPKSSAILEDIFTKNPSLVDEIAPRLKSQFSENDIEEQLRSRIKSRLPEIVHTPENSDIDEITNARLHARVNIPKTPALPGDYLLKRENPDFMKTKIDELNAIDDNIDDDDKLIKIMLSKLQKNFENYEDYGDINCTKLAEDIADQFDLYENDDFKIPDYVFDAAVEAAELYDNLKENDEHLEELNFSNDIVMAYTLVDNWTKNANEFEDESNDTINVGDIESILDILGNYSNEEIAEKEKSFKHPKNLTEFSKDFYDAATERDNNSADDKNDEDFGLSELERRFPEAYQALPESYKNDTVLVFFIDSNGNLCSEGDFGSSKLEEYIWLSEKNEWVRIV